MYRPTAFDVTDDGEVFDLVEATAFGHLVTVGSNGFDSTAMPFVLDIDGDRAHCLRGHVARANSHWRTIDGASAFVLFAPVDSYVSPSLYPSKAVDPRVVPTWNYEVVHVHGTVVVHDDADWVRMVVGDLTERHEAKRAPASPWAVGDAPAEFIDRQLRAIIGIEVQIEQIEAKRKLSQNRSVADQAGVATGLAASTELADQSVAAVMRSGRT